MSFDSVSSCWMFFNRDDYKNCYNIKAQVGRPSERRHLRLFSLSMKYAVYRLSDPMLKRDPLAFEIADNCGHVSTVYRICYVQSGR
jgi:hypothetical protein